MKLKSIKNYFCFISFNDWSGIWTLDFSYTLSQTTLRKKCLFFSFLSFAPKQKKLTPKDCKKKKNVGYSFPCHCMPRTQILRVCKSKGKSHLFHSIAPFIFSKLCFAIAGEHLFNVHPIKLKVRALTHDFFFNVQNTWSTYYR